MNNTKLMNVKTGLEFLDNLVNLEKNLSEVNIGNSTKVTFINDQKIKFDLDSDCYIGDLSRPLIHKLGARLWPHLESYQDARDAWVEKYSKDKEELKRAISETISGKGLKFKYEPNSKENKIYGFVSPEFVNVNQIEFRRKFLDQCRETGFVIPLSLGFGRTMHGNLVEYFNFDSKGFQTEFRYGLKYARNTGYDAYQVLWQRWVLICSNGLGTWIGPKSHWRHNREIDLNKFIHDTVEEGIGNQEFLEKQIEKSKSTPIDSSSMQELCDRSSLANATKDRLIQRLEVEKEEVGNNEWALSQALTFLGTHDRHISFRNKNQLTSVGTDVLESSLAEMLNKEVSPKKDGYFGLVLPSSFNISGSENQRALA